MRFSLPLALAALLPLLTACPKEETEDTGETDTEQPPVDGDGDGYDTSTDCDDADATVHPGATETCDIVDQDCDGTPYNGATDTSVYYADRDGDGWGSDTEMSWSCETPFGYTDQAGDCDDDNAAVHPDADESDCTDPTDYNCDGATAYADVDADGYAACQDCDDANAAVHPEALEVCNGWDDDCDGATDTDATDAVTYYPDEDGDRYGDPAGATVACEPVPGLVTDGTDCDDTNRRINPGATERCDGEDNDCNGSIDDDATDLRTCFTDADADGYGTAVAPTSACECEAGTVTTSGDCDDASAAVHPGADEVCNDLDDDCDGDTDTTAIDVTLWYTDADADGYGDWSASTPACEAPSGMVDDHTDCDDSDDTIHPGATEEECDGVDSDCDGLGYTGEATAGDADDDGWASCDDCDDTSDAVYPGAPELCNDLDDDCDGEIDPATAVDATSWYTDADADGYGDPDTWTTSCEELSGYVTTAGDCDDASARSFPGRGCAWYTAYGVLWNWSYGVVDGEVADVTYEGETLSPTMQVVLGTEEYWTGASEDPEYWCVSSFTVELEPASLLTTAWQEWQVVSFTLAQEEGGACDLLDPSYAAESIMSWYTWGLTVEEIDDMSREMVEAMLVDPAYWEPYLFAGRLLFTGEDPGMQTQYGWAWPVDEAGAVDDTTPIPVEDVADTPDGFYEISSIYYWLFA